MLRIAPAVASEVVGPRILAMVRAVVVSISLQVFLRVLKMSMMFVVNGGLLTW